MGVGGQVIDVLQPLALEEGGGVGGERGGREEWE